MKAVVVSAAKPILMSFATTTTVKKLVLELIKKYVSTKDNNIDNSVYESLKQKLFTPENHKTWTLPVEQVYNDYFISFPDDLLKVANLKEGDEIEWVDNEDGSYTLRKVIK